MKTDLREDRKYFSSEKVNNQLNKNTKQRTSEFFSYRTKKEKEAKEKREETPTYDYTEIDGWLGSLNDDIEPHTTLSSEGPRGKRNNNWMNLRIDPNSSWEGKLTNNTDGSFEQFENAAYGFRAGIKNMQNKIKAGKNTVRSLISIWAPESDNNNTEAYIKNVLTRTGLTEDTILNPEDKDTMTRLAYAIAISENGIAPNMQDINSGWDLLVNPEKKQV